MNTRSDKAMQVPDLDTHLGCQLSTVATYVPADTDISVTQHPSERQQ